MNCSAISPLLLICFRWKINCKCTYLVYQYECQLSSNLVENNFIIYSIPFVWVFIFNPQISWTINFFFICTPQGLSSYCFPCFSSFGRNAILIINKRQAKTIQSVTVTTFTDQNLEKMWLKKQRWCLWSIYNYSIFGNHVRNGDTN